MVLEEMKKAHEMMHTKLISITSNINVRVLYDNLSLQDLFQIEDGEDLGKLNYDGRDEIIQKDNRESQPRGLVISCNNCRDGRILLLPRNCVFLSVTLPNLLTM